MIERLVRGRRSRVDVGALTDTLARAVDVNDPPARRHTQAVAELCVAMATDLGLAAGRIEQLRVAGLLHDVGTIELPLAILNKAGPLSADELELMRTHPELGFEIVKALGMEPQAEWIRHHHERIDGYGYPSGLRGDEIPFESRIIFVADAFEAMTAEQPHRRGETSPEAIARLNRHAGTQFDPSCVTALEKAVALQAASVPPPD